MRLMKLGKCVTSSPQLPLQNVETAWECVCVCVCVCVFVLCGCVCVCVCVCVLCCVVYSTLGWVGRLLGLSRILRLEERPPLVSHSNLSLLLSLSLYHLALIFLPP